MKQINKDNSDRIKREIKEASEEKKRISKEALEQAKLKNKEASDNLKLKNREAIEEKKQKNREAIEEKKRINKEQMNDKKEEDMMRKEEDRMRKEEEEMIRKEEDRIQKEEDRIEKEEKRVRQEAERIRKEKIKNVLENDKKSKLENREKGAKLFDDLSAKFELEHTKIINGSIYIQQVEDKVVFMSRRDMKTSYEHIQCGYDIVGNPVSFIEKWMVNNKTINVKDTMDIYPDVENCPPNVFNLWRPFEMEKYNTPYQQHNDELKIILNHILILCGNDKAMYDYFIGWISKMIQQPHIKLTCMVLISKQGAGKGTLMKLFSKMLGKNKAYEPTNPSRDVWGNFNELMTDAFLVNINELEYNDAKKGDSQFKALITDPNITINPKGQKPIWVKSHDHFIITTNKKTQYLSRKETEDLLL